MCSRSRGSRSRPIRSASICARGERRHSSAAGDADDQSKQYGRRDLLVWLAPASGGLRISVLATSTESPGARYRLTATVYEPDARTAAAATALNDATRLARESTRVSAEAAVPLFEQAINGWTAIGNREIAANARPRLGRLQQRELLRGADAAATLAPALEIYESLGCPTTWLRSANSSAPRS
jgi:hypothetical protein